MLVLSRKPGESIVIDHGVVVTVLDIGRGRVQIGITAPRETRVVRQELFGRPPVARATTTRKMPLRNRMCMATLPEND
jgi:carbon storage regulator CsrA